jgi:hypothetical protein
LDVIVVVAGGDLRIGHCVRTMERAGEERSESEQEDEPVGIVESSWRRWKEEREW